MKEVIVKDLTFSYGNKIIFDTLTFDLEKGSFTTVLGNSGVGKSTLASILGGLLTHKGTIQIGGTTLDKTHLSRIRKRMGFVLDSSPFYFTGETILQDWISLLQNLDMKQEEIRQRTEEIGFLFGLQKYYHVPFCQLNSSKKALVRLAFSLLHKPHILILDAVFREMDEKDKKKAFAVLKKWNQEKGMLILAFTNDVEEALQGKEIMVLENTHLLYKGPKSLLYQEEKKLTEIGIGLPFMVDLSHRLSYYGLVDKPILKMRDMVEVLWK